MQISELRDRFGRSGVLSFDTDRGLSRLHVRIPQAQATMYLQGAHLTEWKPACQDPVIFVGRQTNSRNTVVWNPGKARTDLGDWEWQEMVCVETANVAANARTLMPGGTFTMGQTISVQNWASRDGCSNGSERSLHGRE